MIILTWIISESLKKEPSKETITQMHEILSNTGHYSYSLQGVQKKLDDIPRQEILQAAHLLAQRKKDPINIFKFDRVTYMGYESARNRYEEDKKNGNNDIEKRFTEKQKKLKPVSIWQFTGASNPSILLIMFISWSC